jgi:uncharacterized membrane protein YphA (DoxX/SURF4 family)
VNAETGRVVSVALWIAQLLLAAIFGSAGVMKTTQTIDYLADFLTWPGEIPPWLVRFIGAAELAGALALVFPAITRIRPVLTPLAACGLALIMVFAMAYNLAHGRWEIVNVLLGGLAVFVAWGRFGPFRIEPRAGAGSR